MADSSKSTVDDALKVTLTEEYIPAELGFVGIL